ncbi:AAA family ATPase [Rugamonas rivuli]|uniref:AAA family ATPase n=1 Tax=Rugamonas rivuli TaxID=2743358 RepID=A0A843SLR3_9BURK|nr:AAA family ATPase [Rugamonas rivuli]MQA21246.1 AAA family ATPase [Rugamonas rivuli]
MSNELATFTDLSAVASHLREKLADKKYVLLFAYNGTGKTRLSMEFKNLGKNDDTRDTLYFNAFTEDLFYWDNDLESDSSRELCLNTRSRFFNGLLGTAIDTKIRGLLHRHVDFDFKIKTKEIELKEGDQLIKQLITYVSFEREILIDGVLEIIDNIKISRGEENIFIWCFFLAVAQIALDKEEGSPYEWVKYIYIDDPISSLDDNYAISVANHLGQLLKDSSGEVKTVISSHHALFFNIMCNELKKALKYMLCKHDGRVKYSLKDTTDTPYFHHVAVLKLLNKAAKRNELFTYHFGMLRNIMEKAASFHGFNNLSDFIRRDDDNDPEGVLHHRIIQLLNHGGYSHFEPQEMMEENKQHFKNILTKFMADYEFNPGLFPELNEETAA